MFIIFIIHDIFTFSRTQMKLLFLFLNSKLNRNKKVVILALIANNFKTLQKDFNR